MKNLVKNVLVTALLFSMGGCASRTASVTPAIVTAKVIDRSGPVITVTNKTIVEGETAILTELYKVEDVVSEELTTTVTCENENVTIAKDAASFKTTGEFNFKVVSVDEENNESAATFKVTVNAKPEPMPVATETPEPTAETKSNSTGTSLSQSQITQQTQSAPHSSQQQTETQTQQETTQQQTTSQPVTKYFMFSDGYTMSTALPACKAEFGNYGNGTKKCDPISEDGVYKGYVFTYNP